MRHPDVAEFVSIVVSAYFSAHILIWAVRGFPVVP